MSSVVTRAVGQSTTLAPQNEIQHAAGSEVSRLEHDEHVPSLWPRYLLIALLVPTSLMLLDLTEFLFSPQKNAVYESRNFFGALTIRVNDPEEPENRELVLLNGTTLHGTQFTSPQRRESPTSYYAENSGIGLVLNFFRDNRPPGGIRIGDVGLGAGTLAAYAKKFDHICFYEINPTVIDISTSGKWFTYIADCRDHGAHCDIKLGDARLTLQHEVEAANSAPSSGKGPGEGDAHNSGRSASLPRPRPRRLQRRRRADSLAYGTSNGHLSTAPGHRSQHGRQWCAAHPRLEPLPRLGSCRPRRSQVHRLRITRSP